MDTSIRRIVITEDEDLDLDKLLLGDNSGATPSSPSFCPLPCSSLPLSPPTKNATPALAEAQWDGQKSPASQPLMPLVRGEKVEEDDLSNWILPASAQPGDYIASSPHTLPNKPILKKKSQAGALLLQGEEEDDGTGHWVLPPPAQPGDYINDSLHNKAPTKSILKTSPASAILAEEEDEDGAGHWILPAPAQPGDYINISIHKVPSKSILKKTSSYGNFESSMDDSGGMKKRASMRSFCMDSSSTSQNSPRRNSRIPLVNTPLDYSQSCGVSKTTKKSSYLSLESSSSNLSQGNHGAIGWDLDASPSYKPDSPKYPFGSKFALDVPPPPPIPNLKSSNDVGTSDADQAAGMDSSSSKHSENSSVRMCRNVSFHSVDVREYDRVVGDNPSCRSGPPLSLDWSYSKKYEKNFEEYERERSSDRVDHIRKLHVNKYKRRNLLSFHWGHSEEELKEARRNTRKMQRQRSMTQMMLPMQKAEEAFVGLMNFIKKKTGGGKDDSDDWSEMSNSASTNGLHRQCRAPGRLLHQDSGGLGTSSTRST